jgi:hypothetical protein
MNYLAFKSLENNGETLESPLMGTPWSRDSQGKICLESDGYGVHADSWERAAAYGGDIYLVVPRLFDGDREDWVNLYTTGWRAYGATALAGPWEADDVDGMRKAANIIYAAYKRGYRQHPVILAWVVKILGSELPKDEIDAILDDVISHEFSDDVTLEIVKIAGQIGKAALPVLEAALQSKSYSVRLVTYNAIKRLSGVTNTF